MKVFSFGGGVQSTAALILAAQGKIDYQHFVFANVGAKAENPDTIAYINQVSRPFAQKHGIELIEICKRDRHGNPIDLYDHLLRPLRSVDIPMRMSGNGAPGNRNCTEGWKIKTIAKHIKGKFNVLGKGISTDEISRVRTNSGFDWYTVEYPLIDLGISRNQCDRIIYEAGLPQCPKSSCWFCPFKSLRQWQDLKQRQPEEFEKAIALEKTLITRRAGLGKDAVYLTAKGAKYGTTLDELLPDQIELFPEELDLDNCESGFCMV